MQFIQGKKNFTHTQIAERAGISRATVWAVEKGSASVDMGTYMQINMIFLNVKKAR